MSVRTWAPWASGTATAALTVAVGISINQVHPTNFDRSSLLWLIAALLVAGAVGAVAHWAAPAPQQVPTPRLWPSVATRDGRPRTLGDLSPRDLGAHPSRFAADAESPYLDRDADHEVAEAVADPDQRLVIVSGPRLAGATRTLAHAARRLLADHTAAAFLDDPAVSLRAMVEAASTHTRDRPGVVLWLDALAADRYTELARLDPATLPEGLRILATLDAAHLSGHRIPATLRDHVRAHAVIVDLPALTDAERDRIRAQLADPSDPLPPNTWAIRPSSGCSWRSDASAPDSSSTAAASTATSGSAFTRSAWTRRAASANCSRPSPAWAG